MTRSRLKKEYTWSELIGTSLGVVALLGVAFLLGSALMLIPAWVVHWIAVNLFNYTVLSVWQYWGILIAIRIAFGGLVTVNKND